MRSLPSATLLLLSAAVACTDPVGVQPDSPVRSGVIDPTASLNIYGLGGDMRVAPQMPCASGPSRQFDFWLGEWTVAGAAGTDVANSRILSALDGCAILEYWLPWGGLAGRSLNGYDADAGVWRQTWVASAGRPFRMAGNLGADGVMRMTGTRLATNGWHWIDTYTWTAINANQVVQIPRFDLPEFNLHIMGMLTYTRVPSFVEQPTAPGTRCLSGSGDPAEQVRKLDFTVGDWVVTSENGTVLGTSSIVNDPTLSGCLIEETFTNDRGYELRAFMYYDPVEAKFSRSSIDTEGNWIELRSPEITVDLGGLEGVEEKPGADQLLRVEWEQVNANEFRQVWHASVNDGNTWTVARVLTFSRE